MNGETENNEDLEIKETEFKKKSFWSKLLKIILRIALICIAFVFTVSVGFILLSQTAGFRHWLSGYLYNMINNELEGRLTFSDVKLNPLKGSLEINDVCLIAGGDTLVKCPLLDVNFSVKPLLMEKAIVRSIVLESPVIKILRSRMDSSWNIEHVAKPSTNTAKSKSNWIIDVSKLEIRNGRVVLYDSTYSHFKSQNIDYGNLSLDKFNLKLSALLKLKEPSFSVNLETLNFIETHSQRRLDNLSLEAKIDTLGMEAASLTINTPDSKIDLQAKLSGINVFGDSKNIDFGSAPLSLSMKAKPISTDEFLRYLPLPFKLSGSIIVDISASGNLNNLSVDGLNLKLAKSDVKISGKLKELLNPEKFKYVINIKDTRIVDTDIFSLLHWLDRKSIPDFGNVEINNTKVSGSKDSIGISINASSSLGKITGNAGLGFSVPMTYSGILKTENLNIGSILHDTRLSSAINSSVNFSGSGTDLKNLMVKLGIQSSNSRFSEYHYNNFKLAASVDGKGNILVDTLRLVLNNRRSFDSTDISGEEPAKADIRGILNIKNPEHPFYNFDIRLNGLDIASLSGNQYAPVYFDGDISVKGEGLEPDSIMGGLKANVNECVFSDRALTPFKLDADFTRNEGWRSLILKSDFLNVSLAGNYRYTNLLNMLETQGNIISDFVQKNINKFKIDSNSMHGNPVIKNTAGFEPMSLTFHSDIKDLSLLSVFLKKTKLHSISTIEMQWNVTGDESKLKLDSLIVNDIELENPDIHISSGPLNIAGNFDIRIRDSVPELSQAKIDFYALSDIAINKIILKNPLSRINFKNNIADFEISSILNDMIGFYNKGTINFNDTYINAEIDSTRIDYHDSVSWFSQEHIIFNLDNRGIDFKSLHLERKNAESVSLKGLYSENSNDLLLKIDKFNLKDLSLFMPPEKIKLIDKLNGEVDSLGLQIKGSLNNPELGLNFFADSISYNGTYIGNIFGLLNHKDSLVKGNLSIINSKRENNQKVLTVDVRSLPLNLALTPVQKRIHQAFPFDVQLKAEDLPLELASPFIPALENLKGDADAYIEVTGYVPDKISITGDLQFDNSSFVLAGNNIGYRAIGKIKLESDKIVLKNIELFNMPDDYKPGKALISGEIGFENFQMGNFDIKITSPSLKVLSPASIKSIPALYGDLIVSTGPGPLRFFGSLDEPYLEGDVNIERANLELPNTNAAQVKKSVFRYVKKEHFLRILEVKDTTGASDSTKRFTVNMPANSARKKDIGELIDYDLNIRLLGNFFVNMPLGNLQTLFAELGVKDPSQPLRFVMKHGNSEPNLYGDIVVKEGSTLNFYKQFATSGSISFPTGKVTNPGLDLVAQYTGMSTISNEPRDYTVILYVTGTKEKPIIKFSYTINDKEAVGDSSKIREDAILLLIFGKTKDELKGNLMKGFIDVGSTASAAASSVLTEALQGTGVIQSADIDFGKGTWEDATLKISGQIYGTKWKIGGNVADFSNNSEFSIEYPLPLVLSPVIQITRSINTSNPTTKNQKEFEFKIKIGNSW